MIIPMLCVTIFVILVVWFLLPRVARLMIHTPSAISIFVCLSMVQLMAVFISMRFFFSSRRLHTRLQGDWSSDVCSSDLGIELFNPEAIGTEHTEFSPGSQGTVQPKGGKKNEPEEGPSEPGTRRNWTYQHVPRDCDGK